MIKPDAILGILEIVINSSPQFTNDQNNGVKINSDLISRYTDPEFPICSMLQVKTNTSEDKYLV